ncbi:MAG: ABC transporter ATP-binding protein/permease [marine benthic group bacterium]|nr:ABC transporter ATP-binding protein/permease [Gemmatimonadota bacterium]MCL7962687.1 ABC transporter ATP-binding protein/permease [Candidatus Carthagonibacter metallireducens]MCL7964075.1 ABC transporter ATP-binding protein/permease [Gemmatimonadota bacterium]MCL7966975.1 ABC transporter ATP-binding protein/permease [Gemmatimonadota bacterium]MCL7968042.1 ABC transporter ATP-binding protein/permease [Gemmatimonadota bacterium]
MKAFRTLLPYFRPYRKGLIAGLSLVVVGNVFTILGPWLIRQAIDSLAIELSRDVLLRYALLIVGVALLAGVARFGMRELLNGISRRIETDLRDDLFAHLLRLPAEFYDRWRTGDIMSRATNDVLAVRMVAGPAIMYMVNTATISIFALALMIYISPTLTLFAMIPMALLPIAVVWFGRRIHTRFEQIQEQFSTISNFAQENLAGIRIVKAYVREEDQSDRFAALNREYMDRNMALARVWGGFFPSLHLLGGLAAVVVLWLGGRQIIDGQISVGDYIAFGFYLTLLMWPMIAVGWVTNLVQRGAASMARIDALFAEPIAIEDPVSPIVLTDVRGDVEFDDVWFRYPGTERWVLEGISFRIPAGQTVAIVGATASGKSTLVRLIPRLYDATRGTVRLDGVDVRSLALDQLRRSVAMVPQEPFLFSESLRRNLELAGGTEVDEAVEIAALTETLEDLPDGLETLLGERGVNLSGGQKQRATIARALVRDAPVLILDDSLSAVDTVTEERILHGLRRYMRGRTSIVVAHRVSAVAEADLILVLEDGRLVETGTHLELLSRGGTYARLLERQLLAEQIEAG